MSTVDSFGTRTALQVGGRSVQYFSLGALEKNGFPEVARLPFSRSSSKTCCATKTAAS